MPKSSVIMDSPEPNESSNSLESCLIVNRCLSCMTECTLSIIGWFLLVQGFPEHSSFSTDIHPSMNHFKPLHSFTWPIAWSQEPYESYHRFLTINSQVSSKTWCRCTAQVSRPLSLWRARHAHQQVLANCQRLSDPSGRQYFTHVHERPRSHASHSWPQVPSCL